MPLILTRIGRGTIIVAILVVFNLNENKLLLSIGSLSLKYLDGSPVFGSDLITLSNIGQSSAAIKKKELALKRCQIIMCELCSRGGASLIQNPNSHKNTQK